MMTGHAKGFGLRCEVWPSTIAEDSIIFLTEFEFATNYEFVVELRIHGEPDTIKLIMVGSGAKKFLRPPHILNHEMIPSQRPRRYYCSRAVDGAYITMMLL